MIVVIHFQAYLESFYKFCSNLGGTTADVMCPILKVWMCFNKPGFLHGSFHLSNLHALLLFYFAFACNLCLFLCAFIYFIRLFLPFFFPESWVSMFMTVSVLFIQTVVSLFVVWSRQKSLHHHHQFIWYRVE